MSIFERINRRLRPCPKSKIRIRQDLQDLRDYFPLEHCENVKDIFKTTSSDK